MANSADPSQLASSKANWSGSTLFAKVGYIRFQQDWGKVQQDLRPADSSTTIIKSGLFPTAGCLVSFYYYMYYVL